MGALKPLYRKCRNQLTSTVYSVVRREHNIDSQQRCVRGKLRSRQAVSQRSKAIIGLSAVCLPWTAPLLRIQQKAEVSGVNLLTTVWHKIALELCTSPC